VSIDPRKLPEMPDLMIAGPGPIHDEGLEILGRQLIAHYGDIWTELHNTALQELGALLGASDTPYVIPGTGTTCLDMAVMNLFEEGQKVVVADTGFFGTRWRQIAAAHRLETIVVPVEPGAPIDVDQVAAAADGADGIFTVHVETATGVRHPIEDIAAVASERDILYVIDGIASVGGELLNVDELDAGAVVTGTQKGLETPPGLGILALGPRGRARIDSRKERPRTFYSDLETWDWYRKEWGAWHPHPVTMPTGLVLVLMASVRRIQEAGLEAWVARRADLAKRCREGLRDLGLEPVPQPGVEANLVVAAWADDPAKIQKHLLDNGLMISGGLDPTAGKAIRIGLMGKTATTEMVDRALTLVGEALKS
jgi:alanine-glyoxylate transaminase / serine-glyoxylate transaminase / serine-pyruvate transaminase